MLIGIPPVISPELLKILCEMGHGDYLVIADGNFPSASIGRDSQLVRCDGNGVPELLDAVLTLFPLDSYVDKPVTLMDIVPGDSVATPIWGRFRTIIKQYDTRGEQVIGMIQRFDFYQKARGAYAILATSERAQYGNIILQKGVV